MRNHNARSRYGECTITIIEVAGVNYVSKYVVKNYEKADNFDIALCISNKNNKQIF
jgi:hypothetical protein